MVRIDRISTGGGDKGQTSLTDGSRVSKCSSRVNAYGSVDELNSLLGLVCTEGLPDDIHEAVLQIQNDLFTLGADLSTPFDGGAGRSVKRITEMHVQVLEEALEKYSEPLAPLNSFVLPGGSRAAAWFHVARTVARRAERDSVEVIEDEGQGKEGEEIVNPACLVYLNRLSDLCFVWARWCNDKGRADILWEG